MVQEDLHKISVYKKSQYDVQNCKSGRYNQHHNFKCRRSQYNFISTNIPHNGLMIRRRKGDTSNTPSPCRRNIIIHSINHCQDSTVCEITKLKSAPLPLDKLNMCNSDLSTNSTYYNRSNTNFPLHNALKKVDSNTNLLDKVILTEVVLRTTKKPRIVGPHKLISKKNDNKRKSR